MSPISIPLGGYQCGIPSQSNDPWIIYGLGSCIGLILQDRYAGVSAMAHIVLPQFPQSTRSAADPKPAKYADACIPFLIDLMLQSGALRNRITAQMAGGACMFQVGGLDIGSKNIEQVRAVLKEESVPLLAEAVGGNFGRTLSWDPAAGKAWIHRTGYPAELLTPEGYEFQRTAHAQRCGVIK